MDTPDLDRILDAWGLPRPRVVTPTAGGYQNTTAYVSCASGDLVLRVYTNVNDPTRQRFEHELLRRLAVGGLPFAVPHPVPSDNGDTLRVIDGHLTAVFVRIPGAPANEDETAARCAGARALADIDIALAAMD